MKRIKFVLVASLFTFQTQAQITFERNDSLVSGMMCCPNSNYILQTHDNGYLSAGFIVSGTIAYYFWQKLDSTGHAQWYNTFGYWSDAYLHSVSSTSDNGFILCGNANDSWFPMGIVKSDSNGNIQWEKLISVSGDLYGNSIKQTRDGGYIVAGSKHTSGVWDAELIKLDSIGNILWSKAYGAVLYQERFYDIEETEDSGFVAVGSTNTSNMDWIFIVRTNSIGDTIWTKRFRQGFNLIEARSITETFDNGFAISCYSDHTSQMVNGSTLLKLDHFGNPVWAQQFGAGDSLLLYNVKETTDSCLVLTGTFQNRYEGCLIKTDSSGDTIWTKGHGGMYVCETYDKGFAIAAGPPAAVFKTDASGNTACRFGSSDILITNSVFNEVIDTVHVNPDSLGVSNLITGGVGAPLVERMLCNSLGSYDLSADQPQIQVSPNPVVDLLSVTSTVEITGLELYDLFGNRLMNQKLSTLSADVDMRDLPQSVYFLKLHLYQRVVVIKVFKKNLQ